jgi:hypothetical protein
VRPIHRLPLLRVSQSPMCSDDSGPPVGFLTDFLLALCRSPELAPHVCIYHRLFYLVKQHCCAVGRVADLKEICRAGLGVYRPALGPSEARANILYALGECCEAELNFKDAIEVSEQACEVVPLSVSMTCLRSQ